MGFTILKLKISSSNLPEDNIMDKGLMWNSSLYAMNMFYYHRLIKKLLWPMAGQNESRKGKLN